MNYLNFITKNGIHSTNQNNGHMWYKNLKVISLNLKIVNKFLFFKLHNQCSYKIYDSSIVKHCGAFIYAFKAIFVNFPISAHNSFLFFWTNHFKRTQQDLLKKINKLIFFFFFCYCYCCCCCFLYIEMPE